MTDEYRIELSISEICRLCLTHEGELLPIFGNKTDVEAPPLPVKIMICASVKVRFPCTFRRYCMPIAIIHCQFLCIILQCGEHMKLQNEFLSVHGVLFQVISGDGLPELICHQCALHIDSWYRFKKQCQNSDATLRKYISRRQSGSENDVRQLHTAIQRHGDSDKF